MKKVIKIFLILLFVVVFIQESYAGMKMGGYQMGLPGIDQGQVYSKSAIPLSSSYVINNNKEDLSELYKGTSVLRNYMKFVEVGNAGIHRAMKKGHLNKASIVTARVHKINIPIGYLPIYFKEVKTVVYGNIEDQL